MPHDPQQIERLREQLRESSARLVRGVDALTDEQYAEPSLLPGWTRAHVVAHLALNSEALTGALRGVVAAEPVPMYASQEARDADIEELAGAGPADLRERLLAGVTELDDALTALPDERLDTRIERTPASAETFAAGAVPTMRWREVEIHHADLGAGYDRSAWPVEFAVVVLESMAKRRPAGRPFTADPDDLPTTYRYGAGEGGPTVRGSAADLAWWLTGRGSGEGLTSDGDLPEIGAW